VVAIGEKNRHNIRSRNPGLFAEKNLASSVMGAYGDAKETVSR
jgi:hypothetical protein